MTYYYGPSYVVVDGQKWELVDAETNTWQRSVTGLAATPLTASLLAEVRTWRMAFPGLQVRPPEDERHDVQ